MPTVDAVRATIYTRWIAQWGVTTAFAFENEASANLDEDATAWARVTVRETPGGQETLGPIGNRKYRRRGFLFIQIFTPVDTGMKQAGDLSHQARETFEGLSVEGVDFDNGQIRDVGPDGRWHQTLVEVAFAFESIK